MYMLIFFDNIDPVQMCDCIVDISLHLSDYFPKPSTKCWSCFNLKLTTSKLSYIAELVWKQNNIWYYNIIPPCHIFQFLYYNLAGNKELEQETYGLLQGQL